VGHRGAQPRHRQAAAGDTRGVRPHTIRVRVAAELNRGGAFFALRFERREKLDEQPPAAAHLAEVDSAGDTGGMEADTQPEPAPRPLRGWGPLLFVVGMASALVLERLADERYAAALGLPTIGIAVCWAIWRLMWWEDFDGMQSEAVFKRECKTREPLTPDEFFDRYYGDSGIARGLVVKFLQLYCDEWMTESELIRPHDDLIRICGSPDATCFQEAIEKAFAMTFDEVDLPNLNGRFDTLVRYIASRQSRAADAGGMARGNT
jgi:hypothetical protein